MLATVGVAVSVLVVGVAGDERLELERELGRLEELMGGLENLTKEPDLIVLVNPNLHRTAVLEAKKKHIPIVALGNVDTNPDDVDYLVPGNDKAKQSLEWFLSKVEHAIDEGIAKRVIAPAKDESESEVAEARG